MLARFRFLAPLLVFVGTTGFGAEPPSAAEIAKAVEQLADDDFRVREAASDVLWQAGSRARTALEAAVKSDDPERAQRAEAILDRVRLGILPDTPPDVIKLIHQFRDGSSSVRRRVLQQLSRTDRFETVLALLRSEPDEKKRAYLTRAIGGNVQKLAEQMLKKRDFESAEQILRMTIMSTSGAQNLAVFLALQGKAKSHIERLSKAGEQPTSVADTMLLIQLHRVQGDFAAARTLAEKIPNTTAVARQTWINDLNFANRDWQAVSDFRAKQTQGSAMKSSMDQLSLDAAYHRLGGNAERFAKAIDDLKSRVKTKPREVWFCAEALLINDRQADAIELLRQQRVSTSAFDLLVGQGRYADALKMAGIELPLTETVAPPSLPAKPSETPADRSKQEFYIGVRVAKTLYQLGEKKRALALFATLVESSVGRDPQMRMSVAEALMKLGLQREAFAEAGVAIKTPVPRAGSPFAKPPKPDTYFEPSRVMRSLFGKQAGTAATCWTHLRKKHADEPLVKTLERVRKLVLPKREELAKDTEFKLLRAEWDAAIGSADMKIDSTLRAGWLHTLYSLCELRGMKKPSRDYFMKYTEALPTGESFMKVADLYAAEKNWKEAAAWYKKATDAKWQPTLTLFLQGWALAQAGDVKEGDATMKLARLLPLADTRKRYELFKGLDNRKLSALAKQERQLVVRIGSLHDWQANRAAKVLGNELSKTEPLKAAEHWERYAMSVLRTNSGFLDSTAYLRLPHLIHKTRARGLLESGKHDAATRELWLAHQALPAEIDLVLDMMLRLREAKLDKTAEELFEKVYAVNERITKDFPNSAHHHNGVAWLAARCERRLDDALAHAKAAIKLIPDRAAYLDTLAEVHFARGEKQEAIKLARRCLELEPGAKHYAEQLKRFELK